MVKTTMGTKLPRKLEMKMQTVGEQIRLARLRRNTSPSDTMFRFAMPPADAWLEACTPGTWLLHMFVIAAPTA